MLLIQVNLSPAFGDQFVLLSSSVPCQSPDDLPVWWQQWKTQLWQDFRCGLKFRCLPGQYWIQVLVRYVAESMLQHMSSGAFLNWNFQQAQSEAKRDPSRSFHIYIYVYVFLEISVYAQLACATVFTLLWAVFPKWIWRCTPEHQNPTCAWFIRVDLNTNSCLAFSLYLIIF